MLRAFVGLIIKNKNCIKGHGINRLKITSKQQNKNSSTCLMSFLIRIFGIL